MILPLLCSSNFNNIHFTTSIMKWFTVNISSSGLTHANIDKKDHLGCTSSTIAQTQCKLRHYYLQNDTGFITAKDTTGVGFLFFPIVSPPHLTRWVLPLLLPHANLSQCRPPGYTRPLPGVPRPSVSPIQIRFVPQGTLSWGQQSDGLWLRRSCVFRFQAQIVCTSHFSLSHAPLCFVIELVHVFLPNEIKILWRQATRIYGVLHFSSTWNILFTNPLNILILYNGAGLIKRYVRSVELHKF